MAYYPIEEKIQNGIHVQHFVIRVSQSPAIAF